MYVCMYVQIVRVRHIVLECVHGQCHVMVQFNLKRETKGRPFDVCRLSQPVPSINYARRPRWEQRLLTSYLANLLHKSFSTK